MTERTVEMRELTITTHRYINHIPCSHIDDTKETLVLLFKLLLVENLDGKDTIFVDSAVLEIDDDQHKNRG